MSTVNNSDLLLVERNGNLHQITYDQMSTLNDDDILLIERGGVQYKVEAQYVSAASGAIVSQPTLSATNSSYAPTTFTATSPVISNAIFYNRKWYKDGVEISGATDLTYYATEIGTYKYEETWADEAGNVLTPSVSQDALLLALAAPTINSPAFGSGIPDFDFTAESSAITNANQIQGGWSSTSFDSNGNNNQWKSVAYGNGKYVALGLIGNAYLAANSTDGINWTSYNTIPYTTYGQLAYGDGVFVASGNGKIVYSTNEGQSWSEASVASNWWQGVTYGDGKFVAVSEDGTNRVATSSDGINWSETSAPGNYMWLAVTYGGGKYVAVSQMGDAMYSSDGTNWSTTSVPETGVWNSVAYGNGRFVAVAGTKVIYSTDGINWSSGNNTIGYWKDITFGDGRFVAVSNYQDSNYPAAAGYSTDGDTWTPSNQAISSPWNGVDYVNGRFIAVAGVGNDIPKIMWSTTGIDAAAELTLTDTTVSKSSDGSLVGGTTINHVLTVGETVQSDTTTVVAPAQVWSDNISNISPGGGPDVFGTASIFDGDTSTGGFTNGFNNIMQWTFSNLSGTLVVYGDPNQNHEKTIDGVSIGSEVSDSEGRITFNITESNTAITFKNVGRTYYTTANQFELNGTPIVNNQPISVPAAQGTVSESTGNVINLTDVSGTWSTGMKIRGATIDTMDYPDPIDISGATFTSSEPVVTTGVVNSWTNANAEWQLAHDLLFAGAVQTKGLPITGTGEQTGPDDFVLDGSTDYYVRVKYGTSDPEDTTAEWSTTTHFRTAPKSAVITSVPTSVNEGSSATVQVTTTNVVTGGYIYWDVTNSEDFTTSSGQAYVSSNSATFYVYPTADNTAEGTESFQVKIYSDDSRTDLLDTSDSITINDTSDGSGQYMVGHINSSSAQTVQWICPSYVTSICVLCIGGGGGGDNGLGNYAGGGGGLAWRNNISVTPGQTYWITAGHGGNGGHSTYTGTNGQDGGDSYMHDFSSQLIARGGGGGGTSNGAGGGYTGQGGGTGGQGGNGSQGNGAGGGGAAGYSGNGGQGGGGSAQSSGSSGSGGGAGGGGVSGRFHYYGEDPTNENNLFSAAGSGGGTGVYGQGSSGAGGYGLGATAVGKGGSGGSDAMSGDNFVSPWPAGSFGGGGGQGHKLVASSAYVNTAYYNDYGRDGARGAAGAVRIIWGPGRSFPSTNTQDV